MLEHLTVVTPCCARRVGKVRAPHVLSSRTVKCPKCGAHCTAVIERKTSQVSGDEWFLVDWVHIY